MSNQLRLLIFIVVISGALCTVQDYVITSKCAHSKPIHISPEGIVSIKDFPMIQNITIIGTGKFWGPEKLKITLYAKESKMYLCFDKYWKLVGMKTLEDACYFNETMAHGYLEFRSTVDLSRRVGFTHRGKAIGPKKKVKNDCYLFSKVQSDQYFKNQDAFKRRSPLLSPSSLQTVASVKSVHRNSPSLPLSPLKSSILVENGELSFMRNGQSIRGRNRTKADKKSNISGSGAARNRQPNRHNTNLSNNSTSNSRKGCSNLSSTNNNHHNHKNNVQQQKITQSSNVYHDAQSAQHHPVRHHHDNFNSTARRQQNQRERWLRNNHQQHQHESTKYVHQTTSETPAKGTIASPALPTVSSIPSLLLPLSYSTTTESSHEDGIVSETTRDITIRERKNPFKNRQQQSIKIKDLKNKRILKRQQKSINASSPSSTIDYTEKSSLTSTLSSPLFSLTTENDAILSSVSFAKILLRSTIEPYTSVNLTSDNDSTSEPTPKAMLQEMHSLSTVLADPSPPTQFEHIDLSTIIPSSTTALDVSSSLEQSLDESSFNVAMTLDFNSSGREEANYSPTTEKTENDKNDLRTELIHYPNSVSNNSRVPVHTNIYRNHYTKYSNEDSASLTSVLPNYLDNSMTEYQNSSSSNFNNNENKRNYTKYYKTGNMGSDRQLVAISNAGDSSVTSTNTASTPTTQYRNSKNNSSYLDNNYRNKSRKINSNVNIDEFFPTENAISNKNNKYDNVTYIQPSSYYSNSSTKSNMFVSNLLGSEVKLYYNKKSLNLTASTKDPFQVLTTVSTKTANNHSIKSIDVNNYVDDDAIEDEYANVAHGDFVSEEISGSKEKLKKFGYFPTTTSQLPEIIRIGVNKIKGNRSRFPKIRNVGF